MDDIRAPGPRVTEHTFSAWDRTKAELQADTALVTDEAVLQAVFAADPAVLSPQELLERATRAKAFARSRADEARNFMLAMRARRQRYLAREAKCDELLLEMLHALDRRSFSSPYGTVSVRTVSPSVVILDPEMLPAEYVRVKHEPDKAKLLDDLKVGVVIPGAVLSNGGITLALRRDTAASANETDIDEAEDA
jgi:hypothetical protein